MIEQTARLQELAALARYYILISTTEAGSGHPTSSMSAADLMTGLFFSGILKADLDHPQHPNNDRVIFSKGHAAPLLYALYAVAGKVSKDQLLSLRKFGSPLEGHPTKCFPYTEAATGSLGQGLAIGVGMALNAKYCDKLPYKTYVLLGDSEMSEGSQWEAIASAAHYRLNNLIGILDVNRLGQRGPTMYGHDLDAYAQRLNAFGWETICIDGHTFSEIVEALYRAQKASSPLMIIAKTIKGKGVHFLEDKEGWHGVPVAQEKLKEAIHDLGEINETIKGEVALPENLHPVLMKPKKAPPMDSDPAKPVATRKAYGMALQRLYQQYPQLVVLDAETSNSTYAQTFQQKYPERYFEMYIAEQNMIGVALGLSLRGKIPFVSSFAAFLTRAFDQIRMGQYSDANLKIVGSHAGVSIGQDGASQMGLEDIAMFRTIHNSVVLYPSDAVATEKLVELALTYQGIVYLRTTRSDTPILYSPNDEFPLGGSKILKQSKTDSLTIVAAGITLHEALAAYELLKKEGIQVRIIDLYCIKPLDLATLQQALNETGTLIVVEDHYPEGGIGEAVKSVLAEGDYQGSVYTLAVRKLPRSGSATELFAYEEISRQALVEKVKAICSLKKQQKSQAKNRQLR
ncbi:transketolase [Candidatus Woesearchaeota archaeon]|nr:transketolase [Candidatus Woesearchaeota archaeon]